MIGFEARRRPDIYQGYGGRSCNALAFMAKDISQPYTFNSITALHDALGLPKPLHPLISLVDYKDIQTDTTEISKALVLNFYKVSFKKNFKGKLRYGQNYYDFGEGGLSFVAPNQRIAAVDAEGDYSGYTLLFHPDFIRNYTLGNVIKSYGFFHYSVTEALYLSDKEKSIIISIFDNIDHELNTSIDNFSQDILISQIEQLLNYSNRFYNRQFITRKAPHNDILLRLDSLLAKYFGSNDTLVNGIPTVQSVAGQLRVSPRYLSDMLRHLTGFNTQQYIQNKLIEKAKDMLSTSNLTVAEIAYTLGFGHPQSFNKIFKRKTQVSPVDYRKSFN